MTEKEALTAWKQMRSEIDDENHLFVGTINPEMVDLAIRALSDIEDCRNELCLYCGQYKQRHLGACDGCRWK